MPAGRDLRAIMSGDDFHGFRVRIPRPLMRRAVDEVSGSGPPIEAALVGPIRPPTDRLHHLAPLLHDADRSPGRGWSRV